MNTLRSRLSEKQQEEIDKKVDSLLEGCGGFGRFQWFITISYLLANMSVMLIMMAMSFLTKVPEEYFCEYAGSSGSPQACQPKDFCEDPNVVSFQPNMELETSYYNWVLQYDLHCASGPKIGLISSAVFIGWVITSTFVPRLSDGYFGRVFLIKLGFLISFASYTVLVLSRSYVVLVLCMFTNGMMATIRVQVCIAYLYETLSRDQYVAAYTFLAVFDGFSGVLASLFFMFVSKDATGLILTAYVCLGLAAIAAFFYPESPRYLVKSDQIGQAQQVFEYIANYNGEDSQHVSEDRVEKLFALEEAPEEKPKLEVITENEEEEEEDSARLLPTQPKQYHP